MELEVRDDAIEENIEIDPSLLEETGIQEIDKLESMGINVADIKKLKAAGLYTMASVMMATTAYLTSIKGLSEVKVQKLIECVKKVRCSRSSRSSSSFVHTLTATTGGRFVVIDVILAISTLVPSLTHVPPVPHSYPLRSTLSASSTRARCARSARLCSTSARVRPRWMSCFAAASSLCPSPRSSESSAPERHSTSVPLCRERYLE